MASTKALKHGTEVTVTSGHYAGYSGTVTEPVARPDGDPNQRKVQVDLADGIGPVWILPRQIELTVIQGGAATARPLPVIDSPVESGATVIDSMGTIVSAEPITDPMDPALDRFRPDPSVVKRYIHRTVHGIQDTDLLLDIRQDGMDASGAPTNIIFKGDTQSGKTMLVEVLAVLAAERDGLPKPYPVFTLQGSIGVSNFDMFGMTTAVVIDGREVLVWMEGLVPMAARCGGILYLDEFNAIPQGQAVALHSLLDERRSFTNTQKAVPDGHGGYSPEVVKAAPSMWSIVTINPGYKGTQGMQDATNNRFVSFDWGYDDAVERKLIKSTTVRTLGNLIRQARDRNALTTPVGTSALVRLNNMTARYGAELALDSFKAMFTDREKPAVQTIIEDGGVLDALKAEYPTPTSAVAAPEPEPAPEQDEPSYEVF